MVQGSDASGQPTKPPSDPMFGAPAELLAAIVASSDDAIVSKNLDGIVLSWNRGAEQIFGYSAAEMIGQRIDRIFPPDRLEEEPRILERLKRGERVDHFETIRRRKDGRLIEVSVTISPIHSRDGKIVGASKIARDITAIKRVLRERDAALAAERDARLEAERVSRMKDEFLATLSHELRTPLNAILGWAQVLHSGGSNREEIEEGLATILRNARAQAQLVDDLLDMSRIVAGKLRLEVTRVDLAEVVAESIETVRPAARAKNIQIATHIDATVAVVTGDPNRLQQVVWNLLSNAVKFTPKSGKVDVRLRRIDSRIEITVTDTGQGIEPDFLPSLFTRFSQADASTTRAHRGLGLGLAIVRHLVELHGGTVRGSSEGPGTGATFTVSLPVTPIIDPLETPVPADRAAGSTARPFAADLAGIHVLVIDDEPDARALIKVVLERNGAKVTTASTAQSGLEALQRDRPHVILSDIGMPGMDGFAFIAELRRLPAQQGGSTPAVALTAFARGEDRRRALDAGFQMHVPKPIESPELLAVVAGMARLGRGPGEVM